MASILQHIRKKRENNLALPAISHKKIQNFVVCLYSESDHVAVSFSEAVKCHFRKAHTILFQKYDGTLTDAIAKATELADKERKENYADGWQYQIRLVVFLSDREQAIAAAQEITDGKIACTDIVCCDARRPESDIFYQNLISYPAAAATEPNAAADAARLMAIWLVNLIQGNYLKPKMDDNGLKINCLNGALYDCVERRMRWETAENLAALLHDSAEERARFLDNTKGAMTNTGNLGLEKRLVDTQGYLKIVGSMKNENTGFLAKLTNKPPKWTMRHMNCKEAIDLLYGENYLEKLAGNLPEDAPADFPELWEKGKETILNTTISVLADAARKNGLLEIEIGEIKAERKNIIASMRDEEGKNFLPENRSLKSMLKALNQINAIIRKVESQTIQIQWLDYIRRKLGEVVIAENISDKIDDWQEWQTQLAIDSTERLPDYNWRGSPIPAVPAARLTDVADNRFDVDAGMKQLAIELHGRNGDKLLCAKSEYQLDDWDGPPSESIVSGMCGMISLATSTASVNPSLLYSLWMRKGGGAVSRFKIEENRLIPVNDETGGVKLQQQHYNGTPGEKIWLGNILPGMKHINLPKDLKPGFYYVFLGETQVDSLYYGKKPRAGWQSDEYTENDNESKLYRHQLTFPGGLKVTCGVDFSLYRRDGSVVELPGNSGVQNSSFDFLSTASRKELRISFSEKLKCFVNEP